jgi:hypothetical protein
MTVGDHYLDETAVAAIVTIPIAAGSLAAYLEYVLTMIDARINALCYLSTNTTDTADKAALASVEYHCFLNVMRHTRLSREGVPAEVDFNKGICFTDDDREIMGLVRDKGLRSIWYEEG